MKLKQILIAAAPLITLAAGYLGYQPIQELRSPPPPVDVDIEFTAPEQTQHSHPTHKHEDVRGIVREELEKARKAHEIIHH